MRTVRLVPAYDSLRPLVSGSERRAATDAAACTIRRRAPDARNRNERAGFPGRGPRLHMAVLPNAMRARALPGQSLAARRAKRDLRVMGR